MDDKKVEEMLNNFIVQLAEAYNCFENTTQKINSQVSEMEALYNLIRRENDRSEMLLEQQKRENDRTEILLEQQKRVNSKMEDLVDQQRQNTSGYGY